MEGLLGGLVEKGDKLDEEHRKTAGKSAVIMWTRANSAPCRGRSSLKETLRGGVRTRRTYCGTASEGGRRAARATKSALALVSFMAIPAAQVCYVFACAKGAP